MGWLRLKLLPLDDAPEQRGKGRAYWSASGAADAPAGKKAPQPPAFETTREKWEDVLLLYKPDNKELTAKKNDRKAMTTGMELVPEDKRAKLKKKKKLTGMTVTVEIHGNRLSIVSIE